MNAYTNEILVRDRIATLRHEADQERLVRASRAGRPARDALATRLATNVRRIGRVGRPAPSVTAAVAD